MAQYVGRLGFMPTAFLLLLVPVYVTQLANAGVSATTTTAMTIDDIDVPSRVDHQLTVKSVAVVALSTLPFCANPVDSRRVPFVEFLGTGLGLDLALRWSLSSHDCPRDVNNTLDAVWTSSASNRAIYRFRMVPDTKVTAVYFCLKNSSDEEWSNLGDRVSIKFLVRPE